jgi:chemotaxis protein histidine kinase CheA
MAEQIGQRLGKRINSMYIIGGNTKVIPDEFEDLLDSFTHIIRNSIDHGIEQPGEREAKGKSASGTLGLEIEENSDYIIFKFSDDGRGLQFDEIEKRARILEYLGKDENVETHELISFIFKDNFSTASGLSEISGRGVGLAAVRTAVTKMGGQIKVKSWKDRGTIFTISVPINKTVQEDFKL